jgi:CheY-like chemotaxis protein
VLPGGASGPEYAIEALARYPELKIIFMSGYPMAATKDEGLLRSDDVLLTKPFQISELATVVRSALN